MANKDNSLGLVWNITVTPEEKEAFRIVFEKLKKCNLFCGIYDAANGSDAYMHGIASVMENIAYLAGNNSFDNTYINNMIRSEQRLLKYNLYRTKVFGKYNAEQFEKLCEEYNLKIERRTRVTEDMYVFRIYVEYAGDLGKVREFVGRENIETIKRSEVTLDKTETE